MVSEGEEPMIRNQGGRDYDIVICSLMSAPRITTNNRGCGVTWSPMVHEIQPLIGGWDHFWAYLCVQKNRLSLELVLFENIRIQVLWNAAVFLLVWGE